MRLELNRMPPMSCVMQLLSSGVDVDGACGSSGQTALHAAAEQGHAAMTHLLLACQLDWALCRSLSMRPPGTSTYLMLAFQETP